MTATHLRQRALHARREAQLLWIVTQRVQAKVRQTLLQLRRRQYDSRIQRECERLRCRMSDAHPLTINLTAQILVARGLDTVKAKESIGRSLRAPGPMAYGLLSFHRPFPRPPLSACLALRYHNKKP